MGVFLRRVETHGFTVTAMAFQDAGNLAFRAARDLGQRRGGLERALGAQQAAGEQGGHSLRRRV